MQINKQSLKLWIYMLFLKFSLRVKKIYKKSNVYIYTLLMNIAFWDNQLCERGTTNGLYNYALKRLLLQQFPLMRLNSHKIFYASVHVTSSDN